MATVASENALYPTSDGKPMAETDLHRDLMVAQIQILQFRYAQEPMIYVSGNLLLFYERGNKRKHISPDVFVVKGIAKHRRDNYLLWQEGKSPNFALELTSSSTRNEDTSKKFKLYRDVLKVREYFLFDPYGDYLEPPLQGYRLRDGNYDPIAPVDNRLPSEELGLHLERDGNFLRLYDPITRKWLQAPDEALAQERTIRQQAEAEQQREALARQQAEAEVERLRREVEALRRGPSGNP
jgi:Uma2 family endonuclease